MQVTNNDPSSTFIDDVEQHSGIDRAVLKEKIKNFTELLRSIKHTDDRKKMLWREIYENAVTDRLNACLMYTQLAAGVLNDLNLHALHGQTITKYIERMSRANDQLLKLAELVAEAEAKDVPFNTDEMYNKIAS